MFDVVYSSRFIFVVLMFVCLRVIRLVVVLILVIRDGLLLLWL